MGVPIPLVWTNDDIHIGAMNAFTLDEEIHEYSLEPHLESVSWDELYQGWKNPAVQYYGQKHSSVFRLESGDQPAGRTHLHLRPAYLRLR